MENKNLWLFFMGLLMSFNLFAGDFKGNGGGLIACGTSRAQLLDFYEFDPGPLNKNAEEKVLIENVLQEIKKFSPIREQQYRKSLADFYKESVFLENIPIEPIDDLGIVVPENCNWYQVVNQNEAILPPGKKYLVDINLWRQMSNLDRTGLMLHEIIYGESRAKVSQGIRRLNSMIFAGMVSAHSPEMQFEALADAGLSWFEYSGIRFEISPEAKFTGGRLSVARAFKAEVFSLFNQTTTLAHEFVYFYPSGQIQHICFKDSIEIQSAGQKFYINCSGNQKDDWVSFYEGGGLKAVSLDFFKDSRFHLDVVGGFGLRLDFSENEQIKSIRVSEASFKYGAAKYRVQDRSFIYFDNSEKVEKFFWGDNKPLIILGQNIEIQYGSEVKLQAGEIKELTSNKAGTFRYPDGSLKSYKKGERIFFP